MRIRISSWKPVIFIGVIASLCGGVSTIAYCRNALYKDVSNWQIGDSNPPARLLWQHVEQRVPAYQSSSPPNALVASDAHLAYMRFAYFSACDVWNTITAYDIQNGTKAWQYALPNPLPRDLTGTDDGYLVTTEVFLTKLNPQGGMMWQNQVVPSRAAQQAYQYQDVVYVPSFSKVYLFASKNGHLLSELKIQEVIDYWDDFVLTMWGDNKIDLHKTGTDDIVATLSLDNQRLIPEYRRALFKFTYRFGDVLIVYSNYNPAKIQAFRLTDGRLMWQREEPYTSRPILFNNKLAVVVNDTIQFFDLVTGSVQGHIQLVRTGRESIMPANDPLQLSWIAASRNIIGVYFIDTAELLAIEVDLADFEK